MTVSKVYKTRIYNGLVLFFILLVPMCNMCAIGIELRTVFHNQAELVLFQLYAAPLWIGFSLIIGFELYRQAVMKITLGNNLVTLMALGGLVFSCLEILICPIGPPFWSVITSGLILTSTLSSTILGLIIRYLLNLRLKR